MGKPPNNQAKNRAKFTFKDVPTEHCGKYQLSRIRNQEFPVLGLGNSVFNVLSRDGLLAIMLKITINIYINHSYSSDLISGTGSW